MKRTSLRLKSVRRTGLILPLALLLVCVLLVCVLGNVRTHAQTVLYSSQAPLLEQNPDAKPMPEPPAPVPVPENRQRYVELQNGSILAGELKLVGDQYELTTETGTLFISQSQVARIAENLRQIYTHRASLVFVNDVEARCELIRWCFQYELIEEAGVQLELLRKYAPQHPLLEVFERRLEFCAEQKAAATEAAAKAAAEPRSAPDAATMESQISVGPTRAELDRLAETLSPDALEIFRKKVQPILQKNCMAVECHGPNSETTFRLLRVSPRMGRGEVLQNLYAALQQINAARPEMSPFLKKPVMPHGPTSQIIFLNQDYATYQILIGWTYLVTQNRYVIPRDRLIPPQHGTPVFTPTQRGLQRISSHSGVQAGPCQMVGVDPSLYPQSLYPQDYVQRPAFTVAPAQAVPQNAGAVAGSSGNFPPMKLVLPANEKAAAPDSDADVVPASGVTEPETDVVTPVSAEESAEAAEGTVGASETENSEESAEEEEEEEETEESADSGESVSASPAARDGAVDWAAVRRSISQAVGDEASSHEESGKASPKKAAAAGKLPVSQAEAQEETQEEAQNEAPSVLSENVPDSGDSISGVLNLSASSAGPQVYAPGQSTIEGPIYAPGQSSISRVYAPGTSTASNLQRGNPNAGLAAAPNRVPAPQSPAALMTGRDSVQRSGGSYHYAPNSGSSSGPASSGGAHVWEQMLEMKGGPAALKTQPEASPSESF